MKMKDLNSLGKCQCVYYSIVESSVILAIDNRKIALDLKKIHMIKLSLFSLCKLYYELESK